MRNEESAGVHQVEFRFVLVKHRDVLHRSMNTKPKTIGTYKSKCLRMSQNRIPTLLGKIAQEFTDLNHIDSNFVKRNNIDAKDIVQVWSTAGTILKGYLALPESEQIKIQMLGSGLPGDMSQDVANDMRMKELLGELANHGAAGANRKCAHETSSPKLSSYERN